MTSKAKAEKLQRTRNAAITAALGLLGMAILAPIAHFGVLDTLHQGSLYATLENITNLKSEILLAIIILTIVVSLDGVVAIALIQFFKPSKEKFINLMGWTRIIYAAIFLVAICFLVAMVTRVGNAESTVSAMVISDLKGFYTFWYIALIAFGIHLLLLGWLFFKAKYTPTWLGVLIALAGLGYLIDSLGKLLINNYTLEVSTFTFIGEGILIIWLLIWGRKLSSSDLKKR